MHVFAVCSVGLCPAHRGIPGKASIVHTRYSAQLSAAAVSPLRACQRLMRAAVLTPLAGAVTSGRPDAGGRGRASCGDRVPAIGVFGGIRAGVE
jgi:hypothetical protein